MSICDELLTVLMDKTPKQELDRDICEGYESANRLFENLLQQKLTVRRGYQLLPIENRKAGPCFILKALLFKGFAVISCP